MPYASGDGLTEETAYVISSIDHLDEVRNDVADPNVFHKLSADIDLSDATTVGGSHYNGGAGWLPIGDDSTNRYMGTFDFNGFKITGLNIERSEDLGLFLSIEDATFKKVNIEGTIKSTTTGFAARIGLLAGLARTSVVEGFRTEGLLETVTTNTSEMGGLIGFGVDTVASDGINYATVRNTNGSSRIGGVIGYALNTNIIEQVTRCLNVGLIDADTTLSGVNPIIGSRVGGITSQRSSNCFNDKTASGYPDVDFTTGQGVQNISTADAQSLATYTTGNSDPAWDMVAIGSYSNETWAIDDGNAYPVPGFSVNPIVYPQGPVTFESVARPNAPFAIFSFSDLTQGDLTLVEQGTTSDPGGNVVGVTERDPLLNYMFVVRDLASDYTGTIAAVSGTGNVEIDTGLDLSALNIGTDHYAFRATSGSNAGDEVTVISRSGNTITLRSNPGFQVGDTFIFGRVIKGTSDILLAD